MSPQQRSLYAFMAEIVTQIFINQITHVHIYRQIFIYTSKQRSIQGRLCNTFLYSNLIYILFFYNVVIIITGTSTVA